MGQHSTTAAREEVNPKATARREVLRHRSRLHPDWIARASLDIARAVQARPEWAAARTLSAYLAQPAEVQTGALIDAAFAAGKRVAVPAWQPELNSYAFAWLESGAPLRPGRLGIPEPAAPRWVSPSELDLLLVPLVAFDRHGRRLGHGGGYFDRLLSRAGGLKVGLAFEVQRLTAVPAEGHDVGLDLIITERGADGPRATRA